MKAKIKPKAAEQENPADAALKAAHEILGPHYANVLILGHNKDANGMTMFDSHAGSKLALLAQVKLWEMQQFKSFIDQQQILREG